MVEEEKVVKPKTPYDLMEELLKPKSKKEEKG